MTDNTDDRRGARPPGRPRGDGGDRPPRRRPAGGAEPDRGPPRRVPARVLAPASETVAPPPPPAEERIAKVIARAGVASRRDAEALIEAGRVTLDGAPVLSPALNVGPDARIAVDGEPLPLRERTRLWLFHKPRGLVTTFKDPQGRPTVFDALPEEMPRVVAIGRLDINTEGLLLLTNDGGLAKVIAHPETGWTRRYRVRAHGGEVTQAELDRLRKGVTVDDMEYGPIEAHLDRQQGDNTWLTLSLREGKNREVKRVLEHLGLRVNRLIRTSFGPFQLGDIEPGLVEEVRTKVLKEQLGGTLGAEAGVDFESPVREPIAPFGSESRSDERRAPNRVQPRRAGPDGDGDRRERGGARPGFGRERPAGGPAAGRPAPRPGRAETAWRDEGERRARPPRRHERRDDPKAERAASAERPRERAPAIETGRGRRVAVERLRPARDEASRGRSRNDEAPRRAPPRGERPQRGDAPAGRGDRSAKPFGPRRDDGAKRPFKAGGPGGRPAGGRPGPEARPGKPGSGPRGARPAGRPRPGGPRPSGGPKR